MSILWLVFGLFFIAFGMIVFRGAPYVPTKRRDIGDIFLVHNFDKDDVLVDLGSGDGRVLEEAAKRGVRSVGYELNPLLALLSRFRLRSWRDLARVEVKDFWISRLPEGTTVIFVFLAGPFMPRLDRRLQQEAYRSGRVITLISYGVKIPGKTPSTTRGGLLVYRYQP